MKMGNSPPRDMLVLAKAGRPALGCGAGTGRRNVSHNTHLEAGAVTMAAKRRRKKKREAARRKREEEKSKKFFMVLVAVGVACLIAFVALRRFFGTTAFLM